jgi:hypothetical protein
MIELWMWILATIILFVVVAETLFWLAGKEKKELFAILYGIVVLTPSITLLSNIWKPTDFIIVTLSILGLIILIFLGMTLYEQAGNKQKRWFYLTFLIPILLFVYHFTEKKR